jgi:hypothetical protein
VEEWGKKFIRQNLLKCCLLEKSRKEEFLALYKANLLLLTKDDYIFITTTTSLFQQQILSLKSAHDLKYNTLVIKQNGDTQVLLTQHRQCSSLFITEDMIY